MTRIVLRYRDYIGGNRPDERRRIKDGSDCRKLDHLNPIMFEPRSAALVYYDDRPDY
jgi:hypothetical protein